MKKKGLKDSVELFYDYGLDIENRILYMGSENYKYDDGETGVDHLMAERVIKGLIALDMQALDGDKPITIIMNNVGGDIYHCLAIYDAIKSCKNSVTIIAYGHAMSAGAIILQAADKRVLSQNCTVLVHDGTDGFYGHTQDFLKRADEGKRIIEVIDDIFLKRIKEKHPRYSKKDVRQLQQFDSFLSADKAVELGLADEILKGK